MSRILTLDAKVKVLRGQEHYWRVIRQLDLAGRWSVIDVDLRSNGSRSSIRDFVRKLVAGGYARPEDGHFTDRTQHRLIKISRDAPRLTRDGREIAEPLQERLWRAMKLVKIFTAAELGASLEPAGDLVATDSYCKLLARAGVLGVVKPGKSRTGTKATYRLALSDLGPIAPKILRTKLVYDANSDRILGAADAKEVV